MIVHCIHRLGLISGLFACLAVVGCVPYQTYEELKRNHEQAVKVNNDLTSKYELVARELARLKAGDKGIAMTEQALRDQINAKSQLISQLQDKLEKIPTFPTSTNNFTANDVESIGGGVVIDETTGAISLGEDVLFASGEKTLKPGATQVLNRLASVLKTKYPGEIFHIVGHTDNVPPDKIKKIFPTNTRLGFERAYQVFDFLLKEHRIPEDQMVVHTYGFLKPTDPKAMNSKEGRAKNRRVEIYRAGTKI